MAAPMHGYHVYMLQLVETYFGHNVIKSQRRDLQKEGLGSLLLMTYYGLLNILI